MPPISIEEKRKCALALLIVQVIDDDDDNGDEKRTRGKTRKWIKLREEKGFFSNIVQELTLEDVAGYRDMLRMSRESFMYILQNIEKDISPGQPPWMGRNQNNPRR